MSWRRWSVAIVAALVCAGSGGITTLRWRDAQSELHAAHTRLAASVALEGVRDREHRAVTARVVASEGDAARNGSGRDGERNTTAATNTARRRVTRSTLRLRAVLKQSRVVRAVLASVRVPVAQCLAAERVATALLNRNDSEGALAALNAGNAACSYALSAAHGARYPYDFPDPFVLATKDGFVGYSTNGNGGRIQVVRSTDGVVWTAVGDGLSALPVWAAPGYTWAPSVLDISSAPASGNTSAIVKRYVLFYTVHEAATGAQCISSAVASDPGGPFIDDSAEPLVCDRLDGGSIDPEPFTDIDGKVWLHWKRERAYRPAAIVAQELAPDRRSLIGPQTDILIADRTWDHGVVESPSMVRLGKQYWLLISGGVWNGRTYAQGAAPCAGPAGPCQSPSAPLLTTSGSTVSPGGGAVVQQPDGSVWLAYHAYTDPFVGWPSNRTLRAARIDVVAGALILTPE